MDWRSRSDNRYKNYGCAAAAIVWFTAIYTFTNIYFSSEKTQKEEIRDPKYINKTIDPITNDVPTIPDTTSNSKDTSFNKDSIDNKFK